MMMKRNDATATENISIGQMIRKIRLEKRIPVETLTNQAHITRSMLSQVENNKANPSLRSLMAIAKALRVHVSELFSPDKEPEEIVVRPKERHVVRTKNGVSIYLLTHGIKGHSVGFYYEVYERAGASSHLHTHKGEECGLVLKGKLQVTYDGKTYVLNAGDSIVLNSNKPHKSQNIFSGVTRTIWVDTPPSW